MALSERFAQRCTERAEKVEVQLARWAAGDAARTQQFEGLVLDFHDLLGESKLLGFSVVAETAAALIGLLESDQWKAPLDPTTQLPLLRSWNQAIHEAATKLAADAHDTSAVHSLRQLREQIDDESRAETEQSLATETHVAVGPGGPRRVLLLDDSALVRDVLRLDLESRGFVVAAEESIAGFFARVDEFKPAVIFLDINMPEMNGDEVCRRLRERSDARYIPVVFLSSLSPAELRRLTALAGADAYLSKRDGIEKVAPCLDQMLPGLLERARARTEGSAPATTPELPAVTPSSSPSSFAGVDSWGSGDGGSSLAEALGGLVNAMPAGKRSPTAS